MTRPVTSDRMLEYLADRLDALQAEMATIKRLFGAKTLNASEYSLYKGRTKNYYSPSRAPWRVPQFGFRGTNFTLEEWEAWNDKPEGDLRLEWDAMPAAKRRKMRMRVSA